MLFFLFMLLAFITCCFSRFHCKQKCEIYVRKRCIVFWTFSLIRDFPFKFFWKLLRLKWYLYFSTPNLFCSISFENYNTPVCLWNFHRNFFKNLKQIFIRILEESKVFFSIFMQNFLIIILRCACVFAVCVACEIRTRRFSLKSEKQLFVWMKLQK